MTLPALDDREILAEARRIDSAARRAKARAELVMAWLQMLIDERRDSEAVSELRKRPAAIVPIIQKRSGS